MRPMTFAAALLATLASAGVVGAQSCASYSRPVTTYSTYSYAPPVTYSYAPAKAAYAAPVVKAVVKDAYAYDPGYFVRLTAFFPVLDLPTYGAAVYAPPALTQAVPQAAAAQPAGNGVAEILAAIKGVRDDVKGIERRVADLEAASRERQSAQPAPRKQEQPEQVPVPPREEKDKPLAAGSKAAAANKRACAMCHQRGNEKYGGDFVMSEADGRFTAWTDKEVRAMQRHLIKGTMPKLNVKRATDHGITALSDEEKQALFDESVRQAIDGK